MLGLFSHWLMILCYLLDLNKAITQECSSSCQFCKEVLVFLSVMFVLQVDHLFKHRINSSVVHASDYLKQFPSPIISILAKFIAFVSGGFAAILCIIAFLEESLLEGHVIHYLSLITSLKTY